MIQNVMKEMHIMFERRIPKAQDTPDGINKLKKALDEADAVIVGAGAGLSTSAGFTYAGERFEKYFRDFISKYHYEDIYSLGNSVKKNEKW